MPAPRVLAVVVVASLASGCGPPPLAPDKDAPDALRGGDERELSVPGVENRTYIVRLPPAYDGSAPVPVVYALHGGGGNKESARRVTCPEGELDDAGCISAVADDAGFAIVFPDGSPGEFLDAVRTWNAGGGADGFQCVSGQSCKNNVDDMAFLDTLHTEILRAVAVDEDRVYATGLSNGGAMAHRLACERSTRFAAVAAVGAGNQLAAVQGCTIARAVPVLEIHGTNDPCWTFEASTQACAQEDNEIKVGVAESVAGWTERNGCVGEVVVEELPDNAPDDGMTTTRETHGDCVGGGDVVLLKTEGGGHTWPGGWQYLDERNVGPVTRDYDADDEIFAFFAAHALVLDE